MKIFFKLTVLILLFIVFKGTAQAQYTGPNTTDRFYTVKEIKDQASRLDRSDTMVKLKGFIIKQVNADTYLFKDASDSIHVEIKKKILPTTPFNDKTEIVIIGEVDYDFLEGTEIEVEKILFDQP
ncbi:MAG: NirD/YgiW/YdeI family stress tolerance protein [Breznakibacter sp.]